MRLIALVTLKRRNTNNKRQTVNSSGFSILMQASNLDILKKNSRFEKTQNSRKNLNNANKKLKVLANFNDRLIKNI